MNKNSIIGFVLIFVIILGYSWFTRPSEEELARMRKEDARRDSIARVEKERARNDSIALSERKKEVSSLSPEAAPVASALPDSANTGDSLQLFHSPFARAMKGKDRDVLIENDFYKIRISKKGGVITSVLLKNYVTADTQPLILFDKNTTRLNLILNDENIGTSDLYFEPVFDGGQQVDSVYVKGDNSYHFAMRLYPNDEQGRVDKSRYLEYEYRFKGDDYMIDFNLNMKGVNQVVAPGYNEIFFHWSEILTGKERDPEQERKHTAVYYRYKDDKVEDLGDMKDDNKEELETTFDWLAFKQQFFTNVLISKEGFRRGKVSQKFDKELVGIYPKYLKTMNAEVAIPLSGSDIESFKMNWYFGPTKFKILKQYHMDLDQQIPLGWGFFLLAWINKYAVIPVFDFLSGFGWNYGIIILVLTILLKLVLFPIAYKTYSSSAKMRVLKPEMDEIAAKYPKKEDAMKKQQAIMALYKKVGVNPMAGCVPMLLQMPILIAMFRFFPASIELRQQSFLWATDLSSYDSIYSWSTHIPLLSTFYGNHVSLFTLLMTVSTIFYTKINQQLMGGGQQQMPGMKTVMYLMPIMFLGFFNNYASGLSYYYFLANVITFLQMFLIRKFIDEDKIRKQLLAAKKKPVKKSNFQKRLEEAAKKRGVK